MDYIDFTKVFEHKLTQPHTLMSNRNLIGRKAVPSMDAPKVQPLKVQPPLAENCN